MKVEEIRNLAVPDLEAEILKMRERLFKFRFHAKNEEMQRAGEIRLLRRDIARCRTVLRERELAVRAKEQAHGRH